MSKTIRREVREPPNQALLNELYFRNQGEVDDFNVIRRGYISPTKGFEEDFFGNLLKT